MKALFLILLLAIALASFSIETKDHHREHGHKHEHGHEHGHERHHHHRHHQNHHHHCHHWNQTQIFCFGRSRGKYCHPDLPLYLVECPGGGLTRCPNDRFCATPGRVSKCYDCEGSFDVMEFCKRHGHGTHCAPKGTGSFSMWECPSGKEVPCPFNSRCAVKYGIPYCKIQKHCDHDRHSSSSDCDSETSTTTTTTSCSTFSKSRSVSCTDSVTYDPTSTSTFSSSHCPTTTETTTFCSSGFPTESLTTTTLCTESWRPFSESSTSCSTRSEHHHRRGHGDHKGHKGHGDHKGHGGHKGHKRSSG